jgi:hypothetical protein
MKALFIFACLFYVNTSFCQGLTELNETKHFNRELLASNATNLNASLNKIKSMQARQNTWPQTFLAISALSFVMGTISAFDNGLDSRATIGLYGVSLASASALYITIHQKKKRKINHSNR